MVGKARGFGSEVTPEEHRSLWGGWRRRGVVCRVCGYGKRFIATRELVPEVIGIGRGRRAPYCQRQNTGRCCSDSPHPSICSTEASGLSGRTCQVRRGWCRDRGPRRCRLSLARLEPKRPSSDQIRDGRETSPPAKLDGCSHRVATGQPKKAASESVTLMHCTTHGRLPAVRANR